jgi:UDPglucose--hexose-1-phosphate uridylyltransferase
MSLKGIVHVLAAYRDRIADLKKDQRLRYVLVFKNHGVAAGASLEHSHSQIIALPIIPRRVAEEIEGAKNYFNYKDRCVFCDIIRQELTHKGRVVLDNGVFLAIEPFAARFPFETWILPHEHISSFEDTPADKLSLLAELFSTVLKKINAALGFPPYNYILHTAPFDKSQHDYYHWHFEIIPRLTKVAGFEWGSGFYINPTPPEDAAIYLREA